MSILSPAPIRLSGVSGRYAHAIYGAATKSKEVAQVVRNLIKNKYKNRKKKKKSHHHHHTFKQSKDLAEVLSLFESKPMTTLVADRYILSHLTI